MSCQCPLGHDKRIACSHLKANLCVLRCALEALVKRANIQTSCLCASLGSYCFTCAKMLKLRGAAQNYDWGRCADSSEVAKLSESNGQPIDSSKPYAELWMGTHPKCPSCLPDGRPLQALLEQHPTQLLGEQVAQMYGPQLPFLFKVLSVAKALSIQAHPDKALAEHLHARAPKMYPDDNHKPEMALALGDGMEALCGFVPLVELQHHLRAVPELAECVGASETAAVLELTQADKQVLRAAFSGLMNAEQAIVRDAVQCLCMRLQKEQTQHASIQIATSNGHAHVNGNGHATADASAHAPEATSAQPALGSPSSSPEPKRPRQEAQQSLSPARVELLLRLHSQFPCDVGILASLFLNLVHLPGGSALALGANEPHAYLSGQLVECMANSDNVMRAGLTPKPLDVPSLTGALTYNQGHAEVMQGTPITTVPGLRLYRPPFHEFEVLHLQLPAAGKAQLPASRGPCLLLLQQGAATTTALSATDSSIGSTTDTPSASTSASASAWPTLQHIQELSGQLEVTRGSLLFIAAGVPIEVAASVEQGVVAWMAAVNSVFFQLQDVSHQSSGTDAAADAMASAADVVLA